MDDGPPAEATPLAALRPHPRNYRAHPDDEIEHLMESIREHGVYRNVVCARDGTLLAGHGVVEAARRLGLARLPVRRLDLDPDEPRALKLLAGDNEIAHLGEVDDRALSELLREISTADPAGLLGSGYDPSMLANLVLVTRPAHEIRDFDAAAEWAGLPAYDGAAGDEPLKLVVSFRGEEDRRTFIERNGLAASGRGGPTLTCWWPPRQKEDINSVRFDPEGDAGGPDA